MGLMPQLVDTGVDTQGRGIDVLELDRPHDLRDIARLGLTPSEAKQLLARARRAIVAVQARDHAALRPACSRRGAMCHLQELAVASGRDAVRHSGGAAAAVPLSGLWAQRGRHQLAGALPLDPGAGSIAGTPVRADDLPGRGWRAGPPASSCGRDEARDLARPHAQARRAAAPRCDDHAEPTPTAAASALVITLSLDFNLYPQAPALASLERQGQGRLDHRQAPALAPARP